MCKSLEELRCFVNIQNLCFWLTGESMAKACHFCHFLNSYVCDAEFADCINCGQCKRS